MTVCSRVQLRRKCVPGVYRKKISKAQVFNKNCLEKGKEDTFPLKPFEILSFKSFVGLLAVKMAK